MENKIVEKSPTAAEVLGGGWGFVRFVRIGDR
jgi:hypothetical protein